MLIRRAFGRAVIWVYLLLINFQSLEEFNLLDAYTSVKFELNKQPEKR